MFIWLKRIIIVFGTSAIFIAGCVYWFWIGREATTYSPRYSESKFHQVKIGMTADQVFELLGPPLSVHFANSVKQDVRTPSLNTLEAQMHVTARDLTPEIKSIYWYYSEQKDQTKDYWVRWVIFSTDLKVTEIVDSYYQD